MRFVKSKRCGFPIVRMLLSLPPVVPLVEAYNLHASSPVTLVAQLEAVMGLSKGWDPAVTTDVGRRVWLELAPAKTWGTVIAAVSECDFFRRVGRPWLELATILTTYLESPVDKVLGPALAGVRARLQPAFWTARHPQRKMEVWLLASFLQCLEPLYPRKTPLDLFSGHVWSVIQQNLGFVSGEGFEHAFDGLLDFRTYRARAPNSNPRSNPMQRLRRCRLLSAAEFGRVDGDDGSRSFFEQRLATRVAHKLRRPGRGDPPGAAVWTGVFDHGRAAEALFNLFSVEQRQKLRRLIEGRLEGTHDPDGPHHRKKGLDQERHLPDPFCPQLTLCHIDFLELAAAICRFVRYPFGRLGVWAQPLLDTAGHSKHAKLLMDVWTTACLLQYSGIESEILHQFCEHTLNFHPLKTLYKFDCYQVLHSGVTKFVRRTLGGYNMRQRLLNVNESNRLVPLDKFFSRNRLKRAQETKRQLGRDENLSQEMETDHDPDGEMEQEVDPDQVDPDQVDPDQVDPDQVDPDQVDPDQVDPDQVDPDQVDPDQVDPDQVDPDQGGPGQAGHEQAGGHLTAREAAVKCLEEEYMAGNGSGPQREAVPLLLYLLRARDGEGFVLTDEKLADVQQYLNKGRVGDTEVVDAMYYLTTVPGGRWTSEQRQWGLMAHLLEFFQVPPAPLAEFMLGTWSWASIIETWTQVDPRILTKPLPAHVASIVSRQRQKKILVDGLIRAASRARAPERGYQFLT
ncbi:hypothetical protein GNI_109590 [Gregarina niphandrodes]|uniref:Uncharacterized protein n=1 Tax=Gregarina niphandrodes TaxID=110365 RepID=A0A023B3N1_GRENI|nr:hypothetical protein GNI_109590 [Gregarina niphandrodes]EZG55699.1 hypothetical protein GNI_109590 [Gregarina niphandrodes]|eukprot:XP_011131461.1 hypothetical protein GNI_109590 [Gregarina niphandrodes]